jgi:5,5'-dehydrodivanillate O-demethylase oxygenase subunit
MLAEEQSERLTQVGPGTPAGELFRRYWHPVAATVDLERDLVVPVRILGEDLALFRTGKGQLGLVQQRCAHRSVSLAYGIPDDDGIHCPYHGWCYDAEGRCIAQPFEDVHGTGAFKDRIRIAAYPVRELGGLVWAYMGSLPAPQLPRWDLLVQDDLVRELRVTQLPCNYLQIMENSLDPVHFEWLHAQLGNFVARKNGEPEPFVARRHLKIEFDEFEFGLVKRRLLEGDAEDSEDWTVGHPVLFPNILAQGNNLQYRVPIDDTHTLHIYYNTRRRRDGEPPQAAVPSIPLPYSHDNGRLITETIPGQDMMAWVSPGPVSPRHLENLGRSDRGILMYRKMLEDNIARVEQGEQPMGLIWDAARNEPMISIMRESEPLRAMRPPEPAGVGG